MGFADLRKMWAENQIGLRKRNPSRAKKKDAEPSHRSSGPRQGAFQKRHLASVPYGTRLQMPAFWNTRAYRDRLRLAVSDEAVPDARASFKLYQSRPTSGLAHRYVSLRMGTGRFISPAQMAGHPSIYPHGPWGCKPPPEEMSSKGSIRRPADRTRHWARVPMSVRPANTNAPISRGVTWLRLRAGRLRR